MPPMFKSNRHRSSRRDARPQPNRRRRYPQYDMIADTPQVSAPSSYSSQLPASPQYPSRQRTERMYAHEDTRDRYHHPQDLAGWCGQRYDPAPRHFQEQEYDQQDSKQQGSANSYARGQEHAGPCAGRYGPAWPGAQGFVNSGPLTVLGDAGPYCEFSNPFMIVKPLTLTAAAQYGQRNIGMPAQNSVLSMQTLFVHRNEHRSATAQHP